MPLLLMGVKDRISVHKELYIHWQQCPVSRGTLNTKFGKLIVGRRWKQKLESLFPTGVALKLECESKSKHSWLGRTPEFLIQQTSGGS